MKTQFFFPVLCALMMCFVACAPNEPKDPNKPDVNKDPNAPQFNVSEIQTDVKGGEYQIQLTSPSSWSALPDKNWVSVDPNMGIGNAIVTIKVKSGLESDTVKVKFVNDAGAQILLVYRLLPETTTGAFSVSATKQVTFAPGNLQYQASTNTWRFAEHQYDIIGSANSNISGSYSGWIDLFGWGNW